MGSARTRRSSRRCGDLLQENTAALLFPVVPLDCPTWRSLCGAPVMAGDEGGRSVGGAGVVSRKTRPLLCPGEEPQPAHLDSSKGVGPRTALLSPELPEPPRHVQGLQSPMRSNSQPLAVNPAAELGMVMVICGAISIKLLSRMSPLALVRDQ